MWQESQNERPTVTETKHSPLQGYMREDGNMERGKDIAREREESSDQNKSDDGFGGKRAIDLSSVTTPLEHTNNARNWFL